MGKVSNVFASSINQMFLAHFLYSPRPSLCWLHVDIYQPKPVRALLSLLMGEVSLNIVKSFPPEGLSAYHLG